MNSIFLWNCRGAKSSSFFGYCKQYLDNNKADIVIIMETRINPQKLEKTFRLLGYDVFDFSDTNGFSVRINLLTCDITNYKRNTGY